MNMYLKKITKILLPAIAVSTFAAACSNPGSSRKSSSDLFSDASDAFLDFVSSSSSAITKGQPYYDEVENGVYYYISDVSEEDKKKGVVVGSVSGFRYYGKNQSGEHEISLVADDGSEVMRFFCGSPCKTIKDSDGGRIPYEKKSII